MASDVESSLVSKFQRLNQSLMLVLGINSLMLHRRCNSFLWLLKFDFLHPRPRQSLSCIWLGLVSVLEMQNTCFLILFVFEAFFEHLVINEKTLRIAEIPCDQCQNRHPHHCAIKFCR